MKPNTFTSRFGAIEGEATLVIDNGNEDGTAQVTSGQILLNGHLVAAPADGACPRLPTPSSPCIRAALPAPVPTAVAGPWPRSFGTGGGPDHRSVPAPRRRSGRRLARPRDGDGLFSLIAPSNPMVMYAQYQSLDSTKRSEDGGQHWVAASQGLPEHFVMEDANIAVSPTDPYRLIGGGDQAYVTSDGGGSWTKTGPTGKTLVPSGAVVRGFVSRVVFGATRDEWMVGTQQGQIWYTNDAGATWYRLFEHAKLARVNSLQCAPDSTGVVYAVFSSGDPGARDAYVVEKLAGGAGNWKATRTTGDLPTQTRKLQVMAGEAWSSTRAFVGTDAGVYKGESIGGVWSWKPYNDGLPLADIRDLVVDPTSGELRAATYGRGAWRVITGQPQIGPGGGHRPPPLTFR